MIHLGLWLVSCGWWGGEPAPVVEAAPSPPSVIDTCLAAVAAQRAAKTSDPTGVAKGCADVYKVAGCHDAWLAAVDAPTEAYMLTIASGCRDAYCPLLDPRPTLCDAPELDLRTLLVHWPELQRAAWAHDWPAAEVERLRGAFQAGIK
jgi:hypothetical protein